jgi:hypothetical protein
MAAVNDLNDVKKRCKHTLGAERLHAENATYILAHFPGLVNRTYFPFRSTGSMAQSTPRQVP